MSRLFEELTLQADFMAGAPWGAPRCPLSRMTGLEAPDDETPLEPWSA